MNPGPSNPSSLYARRLGIDSHQEAIVYLNERSHVARSEGFEGHSRVKVSSSHRSLIATLYVVRANWLQEHEIGLSESAWAQLAVHEGDYLHLSHPEPIESFSHVRSKVYGNPLRKEQLTAIIDDISKGRYVDAQIAVFLAACANANLDADEITHLTTAMVNVGSRLEWNKALVADKHCVGGLPGNRTTPLIVAILAANGITIPKTSSRAITSPAGTADCMETMAPVDLDIKAMRHVVERENGCISWGGSVSLSPADDVLIAVEKVLDLDSEGQLIASVLSKKIAAGSNHILIDIPVGPTAKVRSDEACQQLSRQFSVVASSMGIKLAIHISDGRYPVGRGIGPALEAHDVLSVLRREDNAPQDLRKKSLILAGQLLELCGHSEAGTGVFQAEKTLDSGLAYEKFLAICNRQGGFREPGVAGYKHQIKSPDTAYVTGFDNRKLSRLAKLAGAPLDKLAGIRLTVEPGQGLEKGDVMMELHAESPGELSYALEYYASHTDIIQLGDKP